MHRWVTLTTVVAMALAGAPHLFCACGCGPATADPIQAATPACPHCTPTTPDRESDEPKPCECRVCDRVEAVSGGSAPSVAVSATGSGPISNVAVTEGVATVTLVSRHATGPPGLSPRPSSAIPLLLGHLLL